jgi:hypothetical protein
MKKNNLIFIGLILISGMTRLIPHPWNFTPLLAVCIFSGYKIKHNGLAIFLPLISIFIGDLFLGIYSGMVWVYSGYILIILLSRILSKSKSINSKIISAIAGSFIFYIISNFGVWYSGAMYQLNFKGLVECYIAGIPFYKNTLIGTIIYSGIFFGISEMVERNLIQIATSKS